MTTCGVCEVAAESRYATGRPSNLRCSVGNSPVRSRVASIVDISSPSAGGRRRSGDGLLELVGDPAVALGLELPDQVGAALLDDAPAVHDVDVAGLHEVQDALVVRDDEHA